MEQDNAIRIKVTLTVKEVWQYQLRLAYEGIYGLFGVAYIFAGIYLIADTWEEISPLYRALMITGYLVFMLYKPLYTYWKAYRLVDWARDQEDLVLSFGEEGVEASRGESDSFFAWSSVIRAERLGNMMILRLADDYNCLIPDSAAGFQKPVLEAMLIKKMPPERRKRI